MVSWSLVGTLLFAGVCLLVFCVSLVTEPRGSEVTFTLWLARAWAKRKALASPLFGALYDTATDLGVVILWNKLRKAQHRGDGIEHIDMDAFFALGVTFLVLPRFVAAIAPLRFGRFRDAFFVLLFLDFFWLYDYYFDDGTADDFFHTRTLQFFEVYLESIPQMVLQSIFLVRTKDDSSQLKTTDYVLLIASMIASVASITNKIIWVDVSKGIDLFEESAKRLGFKPTKCRVNVGYLLRFLWRFCQVITRMCVLSLIFATIGDVILPIYFLLSFVAFAYCFPMKQWRQYAGHFLSTIVVFPNQTYFKSMFFFRLIDNSLALLCIAAFVFLRFDCDVCADSKIRSTSNPFVIGLFAAALFCFVLDAVCFYLIQPFISESWLNRKVDAAVVKTANQTKDGIEFVSTVPVDFEKKSDAYFNIVCVFKPETYPIEFEV